MTETETQSPPPDGSNGAPSNGASAKAKKKARRAPSPLEGARSRAAAVASLGVASPAVRVESPTDAELPLILAAQTAVMDLEQKLGRSRALELDRRAQQQREEEDIKKHLDSARDRLHTLLGAIATQHGIGDKQWSYNTADKQFTVAVAKG